MCVQLGTGLPRTAGVARPPLVASLPGTGALSGEAKAKAKVAGAGRPRLPTVASRQKGEKKVSQHERISELGAQHVAERPPAPEELQSEAAAGEFMRPAGSLER